MGTYLCQCVFVWKHFEMACLYEFVMCFDGHGTQAER